MANLTHYKCAFEFEREEGLVYAMSNVLSTQQWLEMLSDELIISNETKEMLLYMYNCPDYSASFSEIAAHFNVTTQLVSQGWNVSVAKKILEKFKMAPSRNKKGEPYYYNILFSDSFSKDREKHWVATIRPNLIKAMERYFDGLLVSHTNGNDFETLDGELESRVIIEGENEGEKVQYFTTRYERSRKNRNMAIQIHGLTCCVCGFNFEEAYGGLGKGYIEVHHNKPLYSIDEEIKINPKIDLDCVCSNCHKMLHRKRDSILTTIELRDMLEEVKARNAKISGRIG